MSDTSLRPGPGRPARALRDPRTRMLAAPLLVSATLAAWGLGNPSLSGVEAVSYWAARQRPATLVRVLQHVDIVHAAYYGGVHVLFSVFGNSALVLRLPSAVAGVAGVGLVGLLGYRLTRSSRVGFVAATMLAVNPVVAGYAQLGRSYAGVTALVLAATLLLTWCVEASSPRRWWAYTAVAALMIYLHEFAVLAVAAHAATLLWARAQRCLLKRFALHAVLAVLLAGPLIVASTAQRGQVAYVGRPTVHTVQVLVQDFFGPARWLAAAGVLVAAAGLVLTRTGAPGMTLSRVALPLLVLPPGVLLAESVVAHPLYAGVRYVLFSAAAAVLLVAGGVEVLVRRIAGVVGTRRAQAGGATLIALVVSFGVLAAQAPGLVHDRSPRGRSEDLLAAARAVSAGARPEDGVLYAPRSVVSMQLAYPALVARLDDIALQSPNAVSGTLYGTTVTGAPLRQSIQEHRRVWLVARTHGRAAREYTTLLRRLGFARSTTVAVVPGIRIVLFQHPGAPPPDPRD